MREYRRILARFIGDDSHREISISRLHDRTKTSETTITKLAQIIIMSPGYPFNVKSKGHRVTKCKNIFHLKAIEWLAWVSTLSNVHPLVVNMCWCAVMNAYLILIILMLRTMFIVLSSCQSRWKSSSDECRTAPTGCRRSHCQTIRAINLPVGRYQLHPPSPFSGLIVSGSTQCQPSFIVVFLHL